MVSSFHKFIESGHFADRTHSSLLKKYAHLTLIGLIDYVELLCDWVSMIFAQPIFIQRFDET